MIQRQMLLSEEKYRLKCPHPMTAIGIVIHNTANDATANNEISYMINNSYSTSFHYAVDDIEVVQGLPLDRNSWNAGDGTYGDGNRKYISIEICYSKSGGDRFIQAEKNCAIFVAKLLKDYGWGIDKVKKHQDFSGKYCPHRTLDLGWQRFLDMVSNELNGQPIKPNIPTPQPSNGIASVQKSKEFIGSRALEAQQKLIKIGYKLPKYGADGSWGQESLNALVQMQKDSGYLQVDGLCGKASFEYMDKKIAELNPPQPPKPQGNDWVRRLQRELNAQGYRDMNGNKLVEDGFIGEKTISAFPVIQYGCRGNISKLVQELLTSKGYNTNGIDGLFYNGSINATKQFQRDFKCSSIDGKFGKESLRKAFGL